MENGKKLPSLNSKLIKTFIVAVSLSIAAISIFMPIILYNRDMKMSLKHTRERAQLVRTGILATMMNTGDPTAVRDAVDTYKEVRDFTFRMVRSDYVRKQFGDRAGEVPKDKVEEEILGGSLKEHSHVDGVIFRYVSPFVATDRCGQCHMDLSGNPISPGTVMGLSEFIFDISDMRADSFKLVLTDLVVDCLIIGIFAAIFYFFLKKEVLGPVRSIAKNISRMEKEEFDLEFPEAGTRELSMLAGRIGKAANVLEQRKKARERELELERKKLEQVRSFASEQAGHLGITDENEISEIIKRLSTAVGEVEKSEMKAHITEYITVERKEVILNNNIEHIRPTALYLTDLIEDIHGSVKKGSVELALEEAITNSMVHGNLEVPSKLKEENFEKFDHLVKERQNALPYKHRTVRVQYDYSERKAMFRITDGGKGFNWRESLSKEVSDDLVPHGRGMLIIRTFTSSLNYNEVGNEIIMYFSL